MAAIVGLALAVTALLVAMWASGSSSTMPRPFGRQPAILATASVLPLLSPAIPPQRRRRAVIYARYSTDEQNPRSIDDQVAKCRQFLNQLDLGDLEVMVYSDPEVSGRKKHRPGIDQVMELILRQSCDIVVAVDLSRLYRKVTFALEFLSKAVEADVRVLTINDGLDTNNETWRLMAPVHSAFGEFLLQMTSARIRGSAENRWQQGYAVNGLLPGYRRIASNPNADDHKLRGPYRDERDDRWTPVIREAFERAARGESLWQIAKFFDQAGFPLPLRARSPMWTPALVWRYLRQPLMMGREFYRLTNTKTVEASGNPKQVRSTDDKVLQREMPHLAHVPEWLWHKANEAIRERSNGKVPKGEDHPNTGIPRERWSPLSTIFFCGVCGARMHRDGGWYRCSASKKAWRQAKKNGGRCWNRCGPAVALVHEKISRAIIDALVERVGDFELILETVNRYVRDGDGHAARRIATLRKQEANIRRKIERLVREVEEGREHSSVSLQEALRIREAELDIIRRDIAQLETEQAYNIPAPTMDQVRAQLESVRPILLDTLGREAGAILRVLVGQIDAWPYKAFDSNRIVWRAHFTLKLLPLLPGQWQDLLAHRLSPEKAAELARLSESSMKVDLFEMPETIRYATRVAELGKHGLPRRLIAEQLGIPLWLVKDSMRTWKAMQAAGIGDPYILLTTRPRFTARWSADGTDGSSL